MWKKVAKKTVVEDGCHNGSEERSMDEPPSSSEFYRFSKFGSEPIGIKKPVYVLDIANATTKWELPLKVTESCHAIFMSDSGILEGTSKLLHPGAFQEAKLTVSYAKGVANQLGLINGRICYHLYSDHPVKFIDATGYKNTRSVPCSIMLVDKMGGSKEVAPDSGSMALELEGHFRAWDMELAIDRNYRANQFMTHKIKAFFDLKIEEIDNFYRQKYKDKVNELEKLHVQKLENMDMEQKDMEKQLGKKPSDEELRIADTQSSHVSLMTTQKSETIFTGLSTSESQLSEEYKQAFAVFLAMAARGRGNDTSGGGGKGKIGAVDDKMMEDPDKSHLKVLGTKEVFGTEAEVKAKKCTPDLPKIPGPGGAGVPPGGAAAGVPPANNEQKVEVGEGPMETKQSYTLDLLKLHGGTGGGGKELLAEAKSGEGGQEAQERLRLRSGLRSGLVITSQ